MSRYTELRRARRERELRAMARLDISELIFLFIGMTMIGFLLGVAL